MRLALVCLCILCLSWLLGWNIGGAIGGTIGIFRVDDDLVYERIGRYSGLATFGSLGVAFIIYLLTINL